MGVNKLSNALYDEFEKKLAEINVIESESLLTTSESLACALEFMGRLKEQVSKYEFTSQHEEIDFFKSIKPKFLSKLIYYQKVYNIQSRVPADIIGDIKNYYLKELRKIRSWYHNNIEFLIYYRSGAGFLDEAYFVRKEPGSWLMLNFEDYETDLSFTTIFDHKVSKILAFELLSEFIKTCIDKLEMETDASKVQSPLKRSQVSWTGSKVSLVELLYALQSTGTFNNGNIDLRQLANQLEHFFNIDLGNYYRVFQEMRIRKNNRTTFLDKLKERLIQRMDETDENPKFV